MADDAQLPAPDNADLRARAGAVAIHGGAMVPKNLAEVMEFGQLMAKAGPMVGKAFRGNPGACVAITMQAMRWNMDPFAVSQKAYVTVDKFGNEHIGYEAQLINAVILSSAPMVRRPQYTFTGAGTKRRCKVAILLRGEDAPLEYETPETVPDGNSPLWKKDLDQQLSYFAVRSWSRRHTPELILGVYTPEELANVVTVTSNVPINTDGMDQRPAEEVTEESSGAFIMGEAWTFVREHYTKAFAECESVEEADKFWATFKRKYWVGKRRVISNLSFDGMEIEYDNARARLTKGESLWPWIESCIAGFDDLSALEEWRSDARTEARLALLSPDKQKEADALYEAAQERLADKAKDEIDRRRAEMAAAK